MTRESDETQKGLNRWGMVLAAGRGSRLHPLTEEVPKPLVPICNRTAIDHVFTRLRAAGVTHAVVNGWHLGDVLEARVGEGPVEGPEVTLIQEAELLGTGGGVKYASSYLSDRGPFVLVNGDVVSSVDLAGALRQHNESNAILTLVVVDRADLPNGLRKVAWDTRGRVYEIDGVFRSGEKQGQGGRGIYAGALIGSQTLLDVLPAGREACLKEEGFWPLLRLDHPIHVFATDAYWSDIGTPERYAQTHFEILDGDEALRQSFFPQGVEDRGQGVWAHPSADISSSAQCVGPCLLGANVRVGDGAVVGPYVVMGDNVKVEAGSHVSQTVVWDGVRVVGQKTGMICRLEDETRWSSD